MVDEIVATLERDGYATIPGAIDAGQVAWARAELEAMVADTPEGRGEFEGYRTRRVYGLFGKTRSLDALAIHHEVLGVLDRILGQYQLSAPTGISIGPGEAAQPLHPDDALYPLPRPHDEIVVNVMWPLQDFTAVNGATRIVPGSHRWTDERPGPDTQTITVEIPAGTAASGTEGGPTAATRPVWVSSSTTPWPGSGRWRTTSWSFPRPPPPAWRRGCRNCSATTSIRRSSAMWMAAIPAS
jgi:hypothetical protein